MDAHLAGKKHLKKCGGPGPTNPTASQVKAAKAKNANGKIEYYDV
jgi:hypothetical protein